MKSLVKRILSAALVMVLSFGLLIPSGVMHSEIVNALAAEDYPVQLMHIGASDGTNSITSNGTSLAVAKNSGSATQSFRFEYAGADGNGNYFRVISAASGRALSVSGTSVTLAGVSENNNQLWYFSAVQNDAIGQGLYYKIMNRSNTSNVLTNNNGTIAVSAYSGASSQKWLLNTSGLQGFAGYCKTMNGSLKASTIGGLLGEVVEVDTFDELKDACTKDDKPRTIIITKNISQTGSYYTTNQGRYFWYGGNIYVRDNKTIIGSYGAHDLYNVNFNSYESDGYGHANNVIIRNITISHDKELNHANIWDFADGKNVWIDHCTFVGHDTLNAASSGQVDWDKFLCFYGGSNYVTVSDCEFGKHQYGNLFAYPADTESDVAKHSGTPCLTLIDNFFNGTKTRAPGLMRYGYFHSLNNFVYNFDMGYTLYTACNLYAEKNYYDAGSQKGSVVNDTVSSGDASSKYPGKYSDSGSYHANGGSLANKYSSACSWRPSSNYSYEAMSAADTKAYTMANSGAKDSAADIRYYCLDHNWEMDTVTEEAAVMDTSKLYSFRNVNSGLFLEVEGGVATNGTNVMQGKSTDRNADIWTLKDAGDGYYYLYTQADANGGLCLDTPYGSADNGTSFGIWTNDESDARKYKFIDNGDGSYTIATKSSGDGSCVAVASDSTESGADVIQWTRTGAASQKWVPVIRTELLNGEMLLGLDRLDSAYADAWSIAQNTQIGDLVYGDRDVTYTTLPDELVGAERIMTACDSKNSASDLAVFTAGADMMVYVGLDARVTSLPAWLSDWTKTDMTATNNKGVTFELYAKEVKADDVVTLGTNGQSSGCVNYTVFAVQNKAPETVSGDVNADGVFSVADVVTLQKWLICIPDVTLTDWQAADLCEDGRLDVFDLCIMKRELLLQ